VSGFLPVYPENAQIPIAVGAAPLLMAALALLATERPVDPEMQLESAFTARCIGDVTGAMEQYKTILPSQPAPGSGRRVLYQMGQCERKLGQRAEAHAT